VFLIWLVDGQFPNGRILEADDEATFEEERRVPGCTHPGPPKKMKIY
jgi:hypothetical protein